MGEENNLKSVLKQISKKYGENVVKIGGIVHSRTVVEPDWRLQLISVTIEPCSIL